MKSLHFLYHELRPARSRYSYVIACEDFDAHCNLIARWPRQEGPGRLQPEITFDDGHASDVLYAAPILARYGLRATFFITAGWTAQRAGFMNWTQLRSLQAAGHRIGAHGMTHKLLTACSAKELQYELAGARQVLEDGLGSPVRILSLPGGRANSRVLAACTEAGFEQIYTSAPRAESMDPAPRIVGRLNLLAGTSATWMEQVLRPETGLLSRLQRADRVKTGAKTLLGDRIYRTLWAIANREEPEELPEGGEVQPS